MNYQTKQTLMGRGLSGILLAGLLGSTSSWAQESKPIPAAQDGLAGQGIQANPELPGGIESAGQDLLKQLEASLVELTTLRATIAEDLIALGREQSQLEADLSAARSAFRAASSEYDGRSLELANLQNSKKSLESTSSYLGTLLGEYTRNFESRLLLPEQQRYGAQIEAAKLAPQNSNLTEAQVFEAQLALVQASLSRLEESFGGVKFPGQAVDELGRVHAGNFLLVGPVALFGSSDGQQVGTAEEALNSVQPRLFAFADPAKTAEAAELLNRGEGRLVFDPTLGNARKVEATKETLVEHLIAGGPVMVPILALGLVAFLMVLFKWAGLALLGRPSKKRLNALMDAVESGDEQQISAAAKGLRGPIGRMLQAGVENIDKPKELIEESMFEQILQTKLKLNSFLPFIAVSASAAPLMGLLGTVTGIIDTFKMITVVGSGDVKTLSGGISEALITTEYGLIVAIPSLLLHALLNRKVRGIISGMEVQAINLMNQVGKSKLQHDLQPAGKPAPALSPVGAPHPASPVLATPPQPQVLPQQLEALVQAKVREALASQLMAQGAGSLRG